MLSDNNLGCSKAAKCPPTSALSHRTIFLYIVSATENGGLIISLGNWMYPTGTSTGPGTG